MIDNRFSIWHQKTRQLQSSLIAFCQISGPAPGIIISAEAGLAYAPGNALRANLSQRAKQ